MEQLGCQYKDACHRIYMAQHERVVAADAAANGWAQVERKMTDDLYEMKGTATPYANRMQNK